MSKIPTDMQSAMTAADQNDLVQRKIQMDALRKRLGDGKNQEQKLRESCEGFESLFIQKMWEQMRKNVPKEGYLHSKDEEAYQSMFDVELSKKMSAAGGIGLADMLYDQLSQKLTNTSRTTATTPQRSITPRQQSEPHVALTPDNLYSPLSEAENATDQADDDLVTSASALELALSSLHSSAIEDDIKAAKEANNQLPAQSAATSTAPQQTQNQPTAAPTPPATPVPETPVSTPQSAPQPVRANETAPAMTPQAVPAEKQPQPQKTEVAPAPVSIPPSVVPERTQPAKKQPIQPRRIPKPGEMGHDIRGTQSQPQVSNPIPRLGTPFVDDELSVRRSPAGKHVQTTQQQPINTHAAPLSQQPVPPQEQVSPAQHSGANVQSPIIARQPQSSEQPATPLTRQASPSPAQQHTPASHQIPPLQHNQTPVFEPYQPNAPQSSIQTDANMLLARAMGMESAHPQVQRSHAQTVAQAYGRNTHQAATSHPVWPHAGQVISPFGWQLNGTDRQWNSDIQIAARPGDPVQACMDGTVIFAGNSGNRGNTVILEHSNGLRSSYSNVTLDSVRQGDVIKAGSNFASVQALPSSVPQQENFAPLYFALKQGDQAVNPVTILQGRQAAERI